MSLIITATNSRGVVITADRRTVGHSKKTGSDFIATDSQVKILTFDNLLMGVFGEGFKENFDINFDINTEVNKLKPFNEMSPSQIVESFGPKLESSIPGMGLIVADYKDSQPRLAAWHNGNKMPVAESKDSIADTGIYFAGSGAETAKQLFDLKKPYLPIFDIQKIIDYCTFLIQAVHLLQNFSERKTATVGIDIMVGVIDAKGAQIIKGADYEVNPQFKL